MAQKAIDKWKTKKWYEIVAPESFHGSVIGETFTANPNNLVGRVLELASTELTGGDSRRAKTKMRFRIMEVKGEKVLTDFLGHNLIQDYERTLARKKTSKIYVNETVTTKDGKKLVVKAFAVTSSKVNRSKKDALRNKLKASIQEEGEKSFRGAFVDEIIKGRFNRKLKADLAKIYPLRHAVVQKTELL